MTIETNCLFNSLPGMGRYTMQFIGKFNLWSAGGMISNRMFTSRLKLTRLQGVSLADETIAPVYLGEELTKSSISRKVVKANVFSAEKTARETLGILDEVVNE